MSRYDQGWVKIWRLHREHWLEKDRFTKSVLILLIEWANYQDSPLSSKIVLKRGQVATSAVELSKIFRVGRQRIRSSLKLLQDASVINQSTNHLGSVITICNYDKYQANEKDVTNQETTSQPASNQPLTTSQPLNKELKTLRKKEVKKKTVEEPSPEGVLVPPKTSALVWDAYSSAYQQVYGMKPVRNAMINGQISNLVARLGQEAVPVASWFLKHRGSWYVKNMHPIGLLLKDAEKLHTEWRLGRQMTDGIARQADHAATIDQVFSTFIEENRKESHEPRF